MIDGHRRACTRRRARHVALAVPAGLAAALAWPTPALAHGLVGRTDLPIPQWLFAWVAAVVLVVSFTALGTLWARPQLEGARERRLRQVPHCLELAAGVFGVLAFAVVVICGLGGAQVPTANLNPR